MLYQISCRTQPVSLFIAASIGLILFSGCGKGNQQPAADSASTKPTNVATTVTSTQPVAVPSVVRNDAPSPVTTQPAPPAPIAVIPYGEFKQGGDAYVRIKEFNADNGRSLRFGDAVKLKSKRDGPPIYWLVSDSKGKAESWIPEYMMTPSAAEIELLKRKNCIPETMTFVFEKPMDGGKLNAVQVGKVALPGTPIVATVTDGVSLTNQGSSQVAFKGNAVVFDAAVFKQEPWAFPMVFSDGKENHPMASGKLFYCTGEGDANTFECIDLPGATVIGWSGK